MIKLKKIISYMIGSVYIPDHILHCNEKILLHISDTPASFFSPLHAIIKKLKPDYIVHTGDLVDNIKLEIYPNRAKEYKKRVKVLIELLENSSAQNIYLALGNHDNKNIVTEICKRSHLIEKSRKITIEGLEINISHFPTEIIKSPSPFNLFGHDLTLHSILKDEKVYLNGLLGIYIMTLESKKIFTLAYPYGTNDSRLGKTKIGF
ncbi:metallophosphoesterase [Clostridiaceae bacterium 35-E11]